MRVNWLWVAGAFFALYLFTGRYKPRRYAPGSKEQVSLFEQAARLVGLPLAWASSSGLVNILKRESDGWVGRPNFTYGDRARDQGKWGAILSELRLGIYTARSSATGLGQLLLTNVDKYYPSGRRGLGVPVEEAAGMLRYIKDRYGTPENAWAKYGTEYAGY